MGTVGIVSRGIKRELAAAMPASVAFGTALPALAPGPTWAACVRAASWLRELCPCRFPLIPTVLLLLLSGSEAVINAEAGHFFIILLIHMY